MSSVPGDIRYEFSLRPFDQGVLGRCVLVFDGAARLWDEDLARVRVAGRIRGYRLDFAAGEAEDLDQPAMLHQVSPEVAEFADEVFGDGPCALPESKAHQLRGGRCRCVVYIAELRVDGDFRGRGIGSHLLERMGSMIDLAGCLVALKAAPLASEYADPLCPEDLVQVERFYLGRGFEPASGPFMVKDARLFAWMRKRRQEACE